MHIGHFTEPMLLFGGPYSNLQATQALKAKAETLAIPPERIICTGDIVAYCGQPAATTDLIRDWGIHVLMGNCEESFAKGAEDCGCGFDAGSNCDLLSAQWFNFANQQLSTIQRQWFASLPRSLTFDCGNYHCQVVHGSISHINQFLFSSDSDASYRQQLALTNADVIIAGHCGIPFSKIIDKRLWHNAGAIGMPANDGQCLTWFSLLTLTNNKLSLQTQTLTYDYQSAQQAMVSAGLNNGYASALASGVWPSMDVLPEAERQQQGMQLQEQTLVF